MATELAIIELRLDGAEGVREALERIDELKKTAEGRTEIKVSTENARRKLLELKADMDQLRKTMENSEKGSDAYENAAEGMKDLRQQTRATQTEFKILNKAQQEAVKIEKDLAKAEAQAAKEAQAMAKEEANAAKEAERMAAQAPKIKTFGEYFNKASSMIGHAGSAMQSMGNALTQLTSPFRRFTSGLVMGAGFKVMNKFTEGLSNGFNRYDTMKKYPKIMAAFGYSNKEAEKSIDALDKSVRGLPTGLDEMVDLAQRFTATTGDIDKGTKLAIAANNAFLASMSTDTQKYQGMMQLQDVLGGKDMNAREWNSLVSSMTPAIVKMGESLGYTSDNMSEWIQQVRDGKVSNKDFIDTLIKIGNEGGVLEAMAQESKDTWQAFFANVGNAASRMTAGILGSADEIIKTLTRGKFKSLNSYLAGTVIPGIDNMTASVKSWIKAHPEELTNFFKSLTSINWASLAQGFAQGMVAQAKILKGFIDFFGKIGGGSLAWIGRWGVYLSMAGKALTIFGGFLKGSRHPLGILIAMLAKARAGKKGLIGSLLEKIVGSKVATEQIKEAPKAIDSLRGVVQSLSGLMKVAGGIGIVSLTGWGVTKAVKSIVHDLKDIGQEMEGVNWKSAGIAMSGFAGFAIAFGLVGKALKKAKVGWSSLKGTAIAGAFTTLVSFFASADLQLLATGAKAFNSMTKNLNDAFDNLDALRSKGDIGDRATAVGDLAKGMVTIFRALGGNKKEEGLNAIKPKTVANFNSITGNLSKTLEALGTIGKTLKKLNKGGLPSEAEMESATTSMGAVLNSLGTMLTEAPAILKSSVSESSAGYMKGSLEGLNGALEAIGGENGLLSKMPRLTQRIGGLQRSGMFDSLKGQMQTIGNTFEEVFNQLKRIGDASTLESQMASLDSAMESVRSVIRKLNKIGKVTIKSEGKTNIEKAIDNIKEAFEGANTQSLIAEVNNFTANIQSALDAIKALNEDIEINIGFHLSDSFYRTASQVLHNITSTKDRIKNQAKKGIDVTIPVNVHFSLYMNAGGVINTILEARRQIESAAKSGSTPPGYGGNTRSSYEDRFGHHSATGGLVYRAKGGGIGFPGKPIGTDKVPAWLTAGEYVHRKQAVDFFGTDFMQKVNAMDVRGAMQALLTKAGNSTNIGRQSIVNNTVNNNQRVTQNINTNNPNFTRVQMGRFAGAL